MPGLSSNSRKALLELARNSIRGYLATGDPVLPAVEFPELLIKHGCFITLKTKDGALRGCVGTFDDARPLYENVARMAIAASIQDRRFSPLTKEELAGVRIEISVLGPMEKVQSLDEIEIGRHGIYVKHGAQSGTFLPSVAVEQKWSVAEFVTFCAREKAGLNPEQCAKAEIYKYEVEKFGE